MAFDTHSTDLENMFSFKRMIIRLYSLSTQEHVVHRWWWVPPSLHPLMTRNPIDIPFSVDLFSMKPIRICLRLPWIWQVSLLIHQFGILIFREKSVLSSSESFKNQSDFLKFIWRHDFVLNKLDPRHFLKMVDETLDWCIIFSFLDYYVKLLVNPCADNIWEINSEFHLKLCVNY